MHRRPNAGPIYEMGSSLLPRCLCSLDLRRWSSPGDPCAVIRFLHENKADLTRKDSRELTPLQTALGQAGGFGFGGPVASIYGLSADDQRGIISAPDPNSARNDPSKSGGP